MRSWFWLLPCFGCSSGVARTEDDATRNAAMETSEANTTATDAAQTPADPPPTSAGPAASAPNDGLPMPEDGASAGAPAGGDEVDGVPLPEAAGDAGGGSEGVSCSVRGLLCKRAEPECPEGQVPVIVDGCYGECVAIDECVCAEPADCPRPEQFTCINATGRCSYYLF